jgi:hypothetical protein
LYFFNFYLRDEMPLLDQLGDRTKLAALPKEYFCDIVMSRGPWSSLGGTEVMSLKPATPGTVQLVIADEPAKAKEASLELIFKTEEGFEVPAVTLNGQPLKDLKSTRSKAEVILTVSSADLKEALKRGDNAFTLTSSTHATLNALSVRIVP